MPRALIYVCTNPILRSRQNIGTKIVHAYTGLGGADARSPDPPIHVRGTPRPLNLLDFLLACLPPHLLLTAFWHPEISALALWVGTYFWMKTEIFVS